MANRRSWFTTTRSPLAGSQISEIRSPLDTLSIRVRPAVGDKVVAPLDDGPVPRSVRHLTDEVHPKYGDRLSLRLRRQQQHRKNRPGCSDTHVSSLPDSTRQWQSSHDPTMGPKGTWRIVQPQSRRRNGMAAVGDRREDRAGCSTATRRRSSGYRGRDAGNNRAPSSLRHVSILTRFRGRGHPLNASRSRKRLPGCRAGCEPRRRALRGGRTPPA